MKNILITGGAGYIGSACAVSLIKTGYQVVIMDDFSTGQPDIMPPESVLLEGDVTKIEDVRTICRQYKFVAVIHCAAKKAVGESELNPSLYFHTNVTGSLNVLRAMEEFSIPQIIFSSTAAVYASNNTDELITEESAVLPQNVYGRTKLMVEEMILEYARLGKIKQYTIFRYFNVAGDAGLKFVDKAAQNVFPLLAQAATSNQEFKIFGTDYDTKDGTGVRDYIHLLDLVVAHELALGQEESGIYNLGTETGYSVRDLVQAFNELLFAPLKVKEVDRRPGDPGRLVAGAKKAQNDLNWQPQYGLKEMVKSTLDTYLKS